MMRRADCLPGGARFARPCPYIMCRYHLARPERRGRRASVERDTTQTCALDVAEDGRHGLVEIGRLLGVTRERIRQIETKALTHAARAAKRAGLDFGEVVRVKSAQTALCSGENVDQDARGRDRAKLREYRERHREKMGGAL